MSNLTLDQCIKLKKLGFPQQEWPSYISGDPIPKEELPERYKFKRYRYACPTLEELLRWLPHYIELKDTFYKPTLIKAFEMGDDQWEALYMGIDEDCNYTNHPDFSYNFYGETPLEAVYNLAIGIKESE